MPPLLLSYRQASRVLGIGGDRLRELIKDRHLNPVQLYKEKRLPLEEIERFAREGTDPGVKPRVRTSKRTRGLVEEIDAIEL